ncbi:MAG: HEAT repeat domain-containing protein [Verrucomicrobiota bacterium]|nr:HEAT repeat domain-containing protein [Verrucomicrobiota bacterium]
MKIQQLATFILVSFSICFSKPLEISESDMPPLSNEASDFRGIIKHESYVGHTWVTYPHVENPASLDMDPQGRIFVSEANRFWFGVPDLRRAREMIRGDFRSRTTADRLALYDAHADKRDRAWYEQTPDRLIRLEDSDGNFVADKRTLFSDAFDKPLDGIGFSVLAERNATYFTCIPALRKLTDPDDDGVADSMEDIVEGFGVRVSFIGHDLHGIVRGPDGRLYFSVGDRGYYVESDDGKVYEASGRGAVFRCDSDGSNFEVYAMGLRNPQELAFDDFGNLFTFDNTGDIGDKARVVYVLDNTDSGWDMAHQSPHHYANALDWGNFKLSKSVWVGERMFDTYTPEQPQWVYPPIGHLGNGPSGVTWLSGKTVPDDLRNGFLVTNYRGAPKNSNIIHVSLKSSGASYAIDKNSILVEGVAVCDVEHGYDGNLYLADYGGGWSVNKNGTIQVMRPTDSEKRAIGKETALAFKKGFLERSLPELELLLSHDDQRVRQAAQFAMVKKGESSLETLVSILKNVDSKNHAALHAVWALGQLYRNGVEAAASHLVSSLVSENAEIRANAARTCGDISLTSSKEPLIAMLNDSSKRVVSLAAIALGRLAPPGDQDAVEALFTLCKANEGSSFDVTVRHAILSALSRLSSPEQTHAMVKSESFEQRMLALLVCRRLGHPHLDLFLNDESSAIRNEAVSAIYDTNALDAPSGKTLISLNPEEFPFHQQVRLIGAYFRIGTAESAEALIKVCSNSRLKEEVRVFAMEALLRWSLPMDTDPVLGHYRPTLKSTFTRSDFVKVHGEKIRTLVEKEKAPKLASILGRFVMEAGISMNPEVLRQQVLDKKLNPEVRASNLRSLLSLNDPTDNEIITRLIEDKSGLVRSVGYSGLLEREVENSLEKAVLAVKEDDPVVARSIFEVLSNRKPQVLIDIWKMRELDLRNELWLDLYQALSTSQDEEARQVAATYAAGDPGRIHALSLQGGNPSSGELVFRNQGACLQCHKIDGQGGEQGPELSLVGDRMEPSKLLESLVNPNAEISPGYGLSTISMTNGDALVGRILTEEDDAIVLISPDGKEQEIKKSGVSEVSPPVSAMPPLGMTLNPNDLRDLIAYLGSRNKETISRLKRETEHGEK